MDAMNAVTMIDVKVAEVAPRWKAQYCRGGTWTKNALNDAAAIYHKLLALPETATQQDVAAIVGNESWIGARCDFCHDRDAPYIRIGEEPDYESATVELCRPCARKVAGALIELLNGQQQP